MVRKATMCLTTSIVSNALSLNAAPKVLDMMNLMSNLDQGNTHCIGELVRSLVDTPKKSVADKLFNDDLCMFCDEIFSMVRSTMPQVIAKYSEDINNLSDAGVLNQAVILISNIHNKYPSLSPLDTKLTNEEILAYCSITQRNCELMNEYLAIFKPLYKKVEANQLHS